MAEQEHIVTYTVQFRARVRFNPETDDPQDVVSGIDIPEGGEHASQYVPNSFKLDSAPEILL